MFFFAIPSLIENELQKVQLFLLLPSTFFPKPHPLLITPSNEKKLLLFPGGRADALKAMAKSTPAKAGYFMPAEWERHEATWISWPHPDGASFPSAYHRVIPVFVSSSWISPFNSYTILPVARSPLGHRTSQRRLWVTGRVLPWATS
jgi:hypothetical protein